MDRVTQGNMRNSRSAIVRNNNERKDRQYLDRLYREFKRFLQEMWEQDPQFVINLFDEHEFNSLSGVRIVNLPGRRSTLMEIEE